MARLSVSRLTKTFAGRAVLAGVDLDVAAGSLLAVLGASGSGKTTLLRIVCGFERADSGVVEIDGRAVAGRGFHAPPERRRVGYVAQEGSLFPHLTVAENVAFGLERRERRDRARIEGLLERVGLPAAYAGRGPHQLSGGEQQRVALARALAPSPQLVLLDEPFSALDAALRVETRQAVSDALAAAGATAVLVTHDQSEALAMGAEVAVLRNGFVAQIATPETLYRQPVDAALAQFVGEAVILPGIVEAGAVTCALGRLPLGRAVPDGSADVMLRPEQIRFVTISAAAAPCARIVGVTFYGHDASVRLALAGGAETILARVPGHRVAKAGDDVRLAVEGPVMAYPRASVSAAAARGATLSENPRSAEALGIEETLP